MTDSIQTSRTTTNCRQPAKSTAGPAKISTPAPVERVTIFDLEHLDSWETPTMVYNRRFSHGAALPSDPKSHETGSDSQPTLPVRQWIRKATYNPPQDPNSNLKILTNSEQQLDASGKLVLELSSGSKGSSRIWVSPEVQPVAGPISLAPDYQAPSPVTEASKAVWDTATPEAISEQSKQKASWGAYANAIEQGKGLTNTTILELGGGGWTPIADNLVTKKNGNQYVNVDLNGPGLDCQARMLGLSHPLHGEHCQGILADFTDIPLQNQSVGMVVSVATLIPGGYPDDVVLKTAQEVARVLQPGGDWVFGDGQSFAMADPKVLKTFLRWFEPVEMKTDGTAIFRRKAEPSGL